MQALLKSTILNFTRKPATKSINLSGLPVSLALVIILSGNCFSELIYKTDIRWCIFT